MDAVIGLDEVIIMNKIKTDPINRLILNDEPPLQAQLIFMQKLYWQHAWFITCVLRHSDRNLFIASLMMSDL